MRCHNEANKGIKNGGGTTFFHMLEKISFIGKNHNKPDESLSALWTIQTYHIWGCPNFWLRNYVGLGETWIDLSVCLSCVVEVTTTLSSLKADHRVHT